MHWIYDSAKMLEFIGDTTEIEFRPESVNPFYRIETGLNTCYGDQAFVLLQSLLESKGFSQEDFSKRTIEFFSNPDSPYYGWKSPAKQDLPITGRWLQGSIRGFLANIKENKAYPDCGSSDEQIDECTKIAPLVALYAGKEELLDHAEVAIRTTQNTDATVAFGLAYVRILEAIILGTPVSEAVEKCIKTLRDRKRSHPNEMDNVVAQKLRFVVEHKDTPHTELVAQLGKN